MAATPFATTSEATDNCVGEFICDLVADSLIRFVVVDVVVLGGCCVKCSGENATATFTVIRQNSKTLNELMMVRILYFLLYFVVFDPKGFNQPKAERGRLKCNYAADGFFRLLASRRNSPAATSTCSKVTF